MKNYMIGSSKGPTLSPGDWGYNYIKKAFPDEDVQVNSAVFGGQVDPDCYYVTLHGKTALIDLLSVSTSPDEMRSEILTELEKNSGGTLHIIPGSSKWGALWRTSGWDEISLGSTPIDINGHRVSFIVDDNGEYFIVVDGKNYDVGGNFTGTTDWTGVEQAEHAINQSLTTSSTSLLKEAYSLGIISAKELKAGKLIGSSLDIKEILLRNKFDPSAEIEVAQEDSGFDDDDQVDEWLDGADVWVDTSTNTLEECIKNFMPSDEAGVLEQANEIMKHKRYYWL